MVGGDEWRTENEWWVAMTGRRRMNGGWLRMEDGE